MVIEGTFQRVPDPKKLIKKNEELLKLVEQAQADVVALSALVIAMFSLIVWLLFSIPSAQAQESVPMIKSEMTKKELKILRAHPESKHLVK
jgi:hypothetical protein